MRPSSRRRLLRRLARRLDSLGWPLAPLAGRISPASFLSALLRRRIGRGSLARAAQGRHGALLRCDRFDGARREARPGGAQGAACPVLRAYEGDRGAARRLGGEVHRRRRHGRLRRPGRPRGRRAQGCARRRGDARRAPRARRPWPHRRHDRRGRHGHRGASCDRGRGQRRRAAGAGSRSPARS